MADKAKAKQEETSKEIAQQQGGGELATYEGYGADANVGFEGTTVNDYTIPFIGVLQDNSPQAKKRNEQYIEGAAPGHLHNTVTDEIYDGETGIIFIPVHRDQCYVEWRPRDQGGGYIGRHDLKSKVVADATNRPRNERKQLVTEDGNELIQTAYFCVLVVHEDGRLEPAYISFSSTKLKVYRQFMTKINQFQINTPNGKQTPPLFAHQVRLTTVGEKNAKGEFFNFRLSPLNGEIGKSLLDPKSKQYDEAKKLAEQVRSGVAQANYESQNTGGTGGSDGDTDDVPF